MLQTVFHCPTLASMHMCVGAQKQFLLFYFYFYFYFYFSCAASPGGNKSPAGFEAWARGWEKGVSLLLSVASRAVSPHVEPRKSCRTAMYADVPAPRRKELQKAGRLKGKAARSQAKKLRSFSVEHESVRAAQEISLSSQHFPTMSVSDAIAASKPAVEFVLVRGDNMLQRDDVEDSLLLLDLPPPRSVSPYVECEISMTFSSLEEDEMGVRGEDGEAAVTARQVVAPGGTGHEGFRASRLPLRSSGSLDVDGRSSEGADIVGDKSDSSIVLNTDDDDDDEEEEEEEADEEQGGVDGNDRLLRWSSPHEESLSITMTSVDSDWSQPQQQRLEEKGNEKERDRSTSAKDVLTVSALHGVTEAAASRAPSTMEGLRCVENARRFSFNSPSFEGEGFKKKKTASPQPHAAVDTFAAVAADADATIHCVAPHPMRESGQCLLQSPPCCFEQYVQQGQAKRAQREEEERQALRKEAEEMRYTPQVSLYAEKRGTRTFSEYIKASQEWEQRRRERMKSAAVRLEDYERGGQQKTTAMLNATSGRIVKAMEAMNKRLAVTDSAGQHAALRQSRMQNLQQKYTPSFKPTITQLAERRKREESQARQGEGKSFLQGLYDRFARYREASEKKRARLQKLEAERQTSAPRWSRTETEINDHIQAMRERDERRRTKLQLQVEREREEEEAKVRSMKPRVNPRSAELAERFRMRRHSTVPAAASCSAADGDVQQSPKPPPPPPPQQQQQQQEQEQRSRGRSTNRKLSYSSPSKARGDSCAHASSSSPRQPTVPVISPGFEERNARLLRERQKRAELRRQKVEEEVATACTFRPRTNPASRRMAEAHYRQTEPNVSDTKKTRCAKTTRSGDPPRVSGSIEEDLLWADFVRQSKCEAGSFSRESSRCSGSATAAYWAGGVTANDGDLALQIESLEAMLTQWKQLEEEYRV